MIRNETHAGSILLCIIIGCTVLIEPIEPSFSGRGFSEPNYSAYLRVASWRMQLRSFSNAASSPDCCRHCGKLMDSMAPHNFALCKAVLTALTDSMPSPSFQNVSATNGVGEMRGVVLINCSKSHKRLSSNCKVFLFFFFVVFCLFCLVWFFVCFLFFFLFVLC